MTELKTPYPKATFICKGCNTSRRCWTNIAPPYFDAQNRGEISGYVSPRCPRCQGDMKRLNGNFRLTKKGVVPRKRALKCPGCSKRTSSLPFKGYCSDICKKGHVTLDSIRVFPTCTTPLEKREKWLLGVNHFHIVGCDGSVWQGVGGGMWVHCSTRLRVSSRKLARCEQCWPMEIT